MKHVSKKFLFFIFLASIASNLSCYNSEQIPLLPAELQDLHKKYDVSPDIKCIDCKDAEDCLKIVLHQYKQDINTLHETKLQQLLDHDFHKLSQLKKEAQNYWLYPTQEQVDKNKFATSCLDNLQSTRHFFYFTNQKYLKVRSAINFYKDMPQDNNAVCGWIKNNRLCGISNPLQEYKKNCSDNLEMIRSLTQSDINNYPGLSCQLHAIKDRIQNSLEIIEVEYQKELERERDDQRKNAENQARIDEINARIKTSDLLSKKMETEINTALRKAQAKEDIARKLSQLVTIIKNNSDNNTNNQKTIELTEREINLLISQIEHDEDIKINLNALLDQQKQILALQLKNKQLLDTIDRYKAKKEDLKQKIKDVKKELNSIELQIAKNELPFSDAQRQKLFEKYNNYKKEVGQLTHQLQGIQQSADQLFQEDSDSDKPVIAQAQLRPSSQKRKVPVAQALSPDEVDFFNGPIVEATVIPEEDGRCEKR